MRRSAYIALVLSLASSPGLALAAAPKTFLELASYLVYIMNNAISVVIVLALVTYFWGIFSTIPERKGVSSEQRSKVILYGLLGLFVMVSVWGILRILQETLFSSDTGTGAGFEQTDSGDAFGQF